MIRPLNAVRGWALCHGLKIGLMGGSFNPAHGGHRHISIEALRRLKLDQVWWLVSPQNPLKAEKGMAPLSQRLTIARDIANHPRIRVMDIETGLKTRYTVDTVQFVRQLHPNARFVWIMGADNMAQLPHWWQWQRLMAMLPIAVFDRPHYSLSAGFGKMAQYYRHYRVAESRAGQLAMMRPPAWTFCHIPRNPLSATSLRAKGAGIVQPEDAVPKKEGARSSL